MPAALREIALVYAFVAAVTALVTYTSHAFLSDFGGVVLSVMFLLTALHMARRRGGAARFGIDLAGVLEAEPDGADRGLLQAIKKALPRCASELGVAVLVALVVFPPFVPFFRAFHGADRPFTFQPPREPIDFVVNQVLLVALPEEALFRGYFQTRIGDVFTKTSRVLGVSLSIPALVCQAALFALLHVLVGLSPARLAVFFPGLLFGFLRAFRGGIGASVWFHALSNLLSEILTRGYL